MKKENMICTVLSEKRFAEIDAMIQGICVRKREYAEKVGLSWDEIYQECWLRTMEVIEDYGGEVPNNSLIATCCYNRIVDLGRYQFRRVDQIPVDPAEFAYSDLNSDVNGTSGTSVNNLRSMDSKWGNNLQEGSELNDPLIVEEILDIFPDGTKEKEFVREIAVYIGILDVGNLAFENLFSLTTSMWNEIAKNIGYANGSSSGFRAVRDRVRRVIRDYVEGFNMKFNSQEEIWAMG